jgi:DNA-binding transcriptional LysR family regulator
MVDRSPPAGRLPDLPDLRLLEVFITVCEADTMTVAAARLGLSQSAVSQSVRSLEAALGLQLLDREVRPARLTHAGRLLREAAVPLITQARAMIDRVRASERRALTQIRLGCVDSFAATVGPRLIQAMAGKARQIRMWSGLTPGLADQLQSRELDMVVCTDASIRDPRILQRPLFAEAWVAVYPADHHLAEPSSLKALAEAAGALPLIRYSLRSVIGQQIERWLRHVGLQAPHGFEFDATDPLLSLVASGLGWALTTPLCLWQSRHHLDAVRVVSLPPVRLGQRQFFLLSRDGELGGQDEEVARLIRELVRHDMIPALRRRLPALNATDLTCPDEAHP